jgi:NADH-quinone oxidoreductase subunit K
MFFFSLNILLTVSTIIFLLGVLGLVLNKRNLLIVLMSIELMLLGLNLNFIFFSAYLDDIIGQIFAIYVLTVAAAESSIGLAIFTIYYKDKQTILLEGFVRARG